MKAWLSVEGAEHPPATRLSFPIWEEAEVQEAAEEKGQGGRTDCEEKVWTQAMREALDTKTPLGVELGIPSLRHKPQSLPHFLQ